MTHPVKPTLKTEIVPVILLALSLVLSFYFYSHFPARVPTHWNWRGEIDGWSSRAVGAFLLPGMLFGMYVLFFVFPYLDPKKERYAQFAKVYHIFKAAIIFILTVIYIVAGANALGYNIPVSLWVPFMVGLLFIVLGNYFGKIKPNWFMGIRTPWTLSSEEVWNKTHRLGGKLFIAGGLLMMIMPILPGAMQLPVFILIIFGAAIVPMIYSYILYVRERKNKPTNTNYE